MEISVVIPTKGDVDLNPILEELKKIPEFMEFIIADYGNNVYNRYIGISKAKYNIIFTQDDDCIVDPVPLIQAYEKGLIVNNMKPERIKDYPGNITLIGWGAIFDKELVEILNEFKHDEIFKRECDRVFTGMNKHKTVVSKLDDLPHANDTSRLFQQRGHWNYLNIIKKRIILKKIQLTFKKLFRIK